MRRDDGGDECRGGGPGGEKGVPKVAEGTGIVDSFAVELQKVRIAGDGIAGTVENEAASREVTADIKNFGTEASRDRNGFAVVEADENAGMLDRGHEKVSQRSRVTRCEQRKVAEDRHAESGTVYALGADAGIWLSLISAIRKVIGVGSFRSRFWDECQRSNLLTWLISNWRWQTF
jgi:hypothetical protein